MFLKSVTTLLCGCFLFIGGGCGNLICNGTSTIGGGIANTIISPVSFIGGGGNNYINGTCYGAVAGGYKNCNCGGCASFMGGGWLNFIDSGSDLSVIAGGGGYDCCTCVSYGNYLKGINSFIGGGKINKIGRVGFGSNFSSIVGGCANNIDSCSGCLSSYGFIGGGCANYICTGASFSAILGGGGNTVPAGCSYVGIFGCNINSPANINNCTFHVNILSAKDTPVYTLGPGYCSGTIFRLAVGATAPAGALPLWIMP